MRMGLLKSLLSCLFFFFTALRQNEKEDKKVQMWQDPLNVLNWSSLSHLLIYYRRREEKKSGCRMAWKSSRTKRFAVFFMAWELRLQLQNAVECQRSHFRPNQCENCAFNDARLKYFLRFDFWHFKASFKSWIIFWCCWNFPHHYFAVLNLDILPRLFS